MLHNPVGRPRNGQLRAMVKELITAGFTRKAISDKLHVNYTTVKRAVDEMKAEGVISGYYSPHRLTLEQHVHERYVEEAKRLNMEPTTLMCSILTVVANDNMFKGVLDLDDEET